LDALRDVRFGRDWPRSSSQVGGTIAAALPQMCLVLRIEKLQRGRCDYAVALDTNPLDELPQRGTRYVLDHEARLIGAVCVEW